MVNVGFSGMEAYTPCALDLSLHSNIFTKLVWSEVSLTYLLLIPYRCSYDEFLYIHRVSVSASPKAKVNKVISKYLKRSQLGPYSNSLTALRMSVLKISSSGKFSSQPSCFGCRNGAEIELETFFSG